MRNRIKENEQEAKEHAAFWEEEEHRVAKEKQLQAQLSSKRLHTRQAARAHKKIRVVVRNVVGHEERIQMRAGDEHPSLHLHAA